MGVDLQVEDEGSRRRTATNAQSPPGCRCAVGGNYIESETIAAVHRPEQIICLPPAACGDAGSRVPAAYRYTLVSYIAMGAFAIVGGMFEPGGAFLVLISAAAATRWEEPRPWPGGRNCCKIPPWASRQKSRFRSLVTRVGLSPRRSSRLRLWPFSSPASPYKTVVFTNPV